MKRIDVTLGERTYPVLIANGLIDEAGRRLLPFAPRQRLIVVSDANVWRAWGDRFSASLHRAGIALSSIILPPGEEAKSWAGLSDLVERLLASDISRGDHVVAFGGGVIGDLAGFASAITKRGVGYVQIPTTLLAQVDSSVGGKTAINVAAGKNLVGAFHQPSAVLIDPTTLDTLPDRQIRAGYAEVVKYGLIGDAAFFEWCEANGDRLFGGDGDAQLYAIDTCIRAKAQIVALDEREMSGTRALLNLGHTFGHALEAEAGFSDALLHGEAVAVGMTLAFRFSAERGLCLRSDGERVAAHLDSVGLPTRISLATTPERLLAHMAKDKKRSGEALALVLAHGIGAAFLDGEVPPEEVCAFLERALGN